MIVGPGFKEAFLPGYPADENGFILESDYAGRELREVDFTQGKKVGRFDAFDYFGDGSFYLLDSPGHAVGHLCGLARVTSNPDSYILSKPLLATRSWLWLELVRACADD